MSGGYYGDYFKGYDGKSGLNGLGKVVDEVGKGGYHAVLTISLFVCVISILLVFISRFIFRVASPREDAQAKMYVQRILLVVVGLSFITSLFSAAIMLGESF